MALSDQVIERIKRLMEVRGMQQKDLAEKAKIQRPNLSNYLRGVNLPGLEALEAIAKALGFPPYVLFTDLSEDEQLSELFDMVQKRAHASAEGNARSADLAKRYREINEILSKELDAAKATAVSSPEESKLLKLFRSLSADDRASVLSLAKSLAPGKDNKLASRRARS